MEKTPMKVILKEQTNYNTLYMVLENNKYHFQIIYKTNNYENDYKNNQINPENLTILDTSDNILNPIQIIILTKNKNNPHARIGLLFNQDCFSIDRINKLYEEIKEAEETIEEVKAILNEHFPGSID